MTTVQALTFLMIAQALHFKFTLIDGDLPLLNLKLPYLSAHEPFLLASVFQIHSNKVTTSNRALTTVHTLHWL
jgi:hypothetical protein